MFLFWSSGSSILAQTTQTFNYTGATQTFTVPCVNSITVKAWGAGGGGGGNDVKPGNIGGGGAYVTSVIAVTPGQVLTIYVGGGGAGGVNGATGNGGGAGGFGLGTGGTGGNAGPNGGSGGGGGGGGGTGIYNGATLLVVAGGGGGSGGGGQYVMAAAGGGGGQNGFSTSVVGGTVGTSATTNGIQGASPSNDDGGGGGGGGGLLGGGGGNSPNSDDGGSGGAGGTSQGTTVTNGNGQTPGNSADPDLCVNCAKGGAQGAAGGNGFLEISYSPLTVLPVATTTMACVNATATVSPSGGALPYTYNWLPNGGTTSTVSNLLSGNYTVTVTDANNCSVSKAFTISEAALSSISVTSPINPYCDTTKLDWVTWSSVNATSGVGTISSNLSLTLTKPTGGLSLTPSMYSSGTFPTQYNIPINNQTLENTLAGVFTFCFSKPVVAPQVAFSSIGSGSITVPIITSVPYSVIWSGSGMSYPNNTTLVGTEGYTIIEFPGQHSCLSFNYEVSENYCNLAFGIRDTNCQTTPICKGIPATFTATGAVTYTWSPSTGLNQSTGSVVSANPSSYQTYTIIGTDAKGCKDTAITSVSVNSLPIPSVSSFTNVSCFGGNNGAVITNVTSGLTPYTYTWTNGNTSLKDSSLVKGTYSLTVTDANGCKGSTSQVISQPNVLKDSIVSFKNVSCFGIPTGSVTVGVIGGTTPYTYSWSPSGGTDATANNLPVGNYTVTVNDFNLCSTTATISITQPPALTLTATQNNVSCTGLSNGTATATATGGTASYTIGINSNPVQGGVTATGIETVSGLPAGSYTFGVQDANGCQDFFPITITEPTVLRDSIYIATNVSCFGGSNGTANATAWGGTSPYSYSWNSSPVQTTANASNLPTGTFMVTVKDANGCAKSSSVTISQPPAITTVTTQTNVTCQGLNNGIANVNASGGSGLFDYTWSTNPVQVTSTASGLAPGTYTATISNSGCSPSGTELVTNGDFDLGNTGFTSSYGYTPPPNSSEGQYWVSTGSQVSTWNGAMTSNGDHTTGSGNIMMVNGAGTANSNVWCETISVSPNTNYLFSTWVSSLDASSPALLQFSINGGTIGNIFSAPPTSNVWSQFASSFNSGVNTNATICIVNQNTSTSGNDFALDDISFQPCAPTCSITTTVTITEPATLKDTILATNVTCNGLSTGSATVTVKGGTAPYTYTWTNTSNTTISSNLAAGTDTVKVTDSNNCMATATVTITQPTALKDSIVKSTNVSCFGGNNGSATVGVTGGTRPYVYVWSNGIADSTATGLVAGTYTAGVKDAHGCPDTVSVVITQPATGLKDTILATNVTCNGFSNGSATVTVTGGTKAYSYTWSNGSTDSTASGLTAATYTVKVKDAKGCKDSATVKIMQPKILTDTSVGKTICIGQSAVLTTTTNGGGTAPYVYSWNGIKTTSNDTSVKPTLTTTYTLVVTDAKGCVATNTVTVIVRPPLSVSFISPDTAGCLGETAHLNATGSGGDNTYNYAWSPGSIPPNQFITVKPTITTTYTLTLTDGCGTPPAIDSVKVTVNPLPNVAFTASPPQGCYPLPVQFTNNTTISSGTVSSYTWSFGNGHSSNLNAPPTQKYTKSGNFTVRLIAQSDKGCISRDSMIEIIFPHPKAAFSTSPNDVTIINPSVQFTDGSTAPGSSVSSLLWLNFGDATDSTSSSPNPIHAYQDTGTYHVTLIATNAFGCKDTTIQPVVISPYFTLYIPNAFTPNGDIYNGTFTAVGDYISSYDMKIFDRWGALIFESTSIERGWNGTKNNVIAEEGVYVYVLHVMDTYYNPHVYKGTVTLIR